MPTIDLKNKAVIVSGAAGLLGRAMSHALLKSGANLILNDVNDADLCRFESELNNKNKVFAVPGSISESRFVEQILKLGTERFGSVDGAVNCTYPRNDKYGAHFFDVTYEDFVDNVGMHLGGYFIFMQQCAKYAFETGKPFSLVSMSSIYGVMAPRFELYEGTMMTNPPEYAAIKSAIQHLTSYVTKLTKGSMFRANCVSPGGIFANQAPSFLDKYKSYCRIKGMLDADDVVGSVLFLLSDASSYICGQNIVVDDGFSC